MLKADQKANRTNPQNAFPGRLSAFPQGHTCRGLDFAAFPFARIKGCAGGADSVGFSNRSAEVFTMKRRSQNALSVAMGALLAGSLAIAPVSAAPDGPQTRIYSDTFTPLMRIPDEQALQNCRYCSHPGAAPNWILPAFSDHGHDAFLNSPDLTFGTNALSAVSAEVCLELDGDQDSAFALIYFGVQDKDRNVVFWTDPDTQYPFLEVTTVGSQLCETLTFPSPVKLVNHPHLVVAVELILESGANYAEVDGVTYTLRPSKASDVTPNSTWPYAFALGRFEED